MKKLALAVMVISFGALMVAGCPEDKPKTNTPATNTPTNAPANS